MVYGMNGWHFMILQFCNSVVEHIPNCLTGVTRRRGGNVTALITAESGHLAGAVGGARDS